MDGSCIAGHKKNAKLGTGWRGQGIEGYVGGPLWMLRPALDCSSNEEKETTNGWD